MSFLSSLSLFRQPPAEQVQVPVPHDLAEVDATSKAFGPDNLDGCYQLIGLDDDIDLEENQAAAFVQQIEAQVQKSGRLGNRIAAGIFLSMYREQFKGKEAVTQKLLKNLKIPLSSDNAKKITVFAQAEFLNKLKKTSQQERTEAFEAAALEIRQAFGIEQ